MPTLRLDILPLRSIFRLTSSITAITLHPYETRNQQPAQSIKTMVRMTKQAKNKSAEYLAMDFVEHVLWANSANTKPSSFKSFCTWWKHNAEDYKLPIEVSFSAWKEIVKRAKVKVQIQF